MKAFLNLGCNGLKKTGLTLCPGTNNRIADLRRIKSGSEHIIEYLDKHCKIFDEHAYTLNKINSIVGMLAKEGIILPPTEKTIHDLFAMHKACGLFLYIDPLDDDI